MKSRIAKSLTVAALVATLAACSSVPFDDKGGQGAGSAGTTVGGTGPVMDPFNPSSPLAQQKSVFFDLTAIRSATSTSPWCRCTRAT